MNITAIFLKIVRFFLLACFLIFALFPIYWMFLTSIKPPGQAVQIPIKYWTDRPTFDNYISIFTDSAFPVFFKNSLIVGVSSALITLLFSLLAGYSLARFRFRGKRVTLFIFLITQMFPVVVMIVPLFIAFSKLGLLNTLACLIVSYSVINIPFCTVMIKGFFDRAPAALEEAALIDGCSQFGALFRILIPVMMPGVVATFAFAFISAWNEFFFSLMFINSEELKTIPAGIGIFVSQFEVNWSHLSAGTIVAILPSIVLFILIQKYLIRGLTAGAVK
jgi:multiple sugar transport system permease protein